MKWVRDGKGLEYREHPTRRYGLRKDRYYRGRYKMDQRETVISFGWETEKGVEGRESFRDACLKQLLDLKANARKGEGPISLKQQREQALSKKQAEDREAVTFGQYFDSTYLPTAETHKKPQTMAEERSIYKKWLAPYIGKMKLIDLRPIHVERVKKAMLDDGRAPRRVQYALAVIRQTWNHARNSGLVAGDWPGRGVKIPRFDNRRMRFLSPQDADDLLAEIKIRSEQTYSIALVSLDCGLRFGEIVALQWGHIDTEQGLLMVMDSKSGKNRAAFMTARVRDMFRAMPQGKKTDLVFKDRDGNPITKVSHSFFRSVDELHLNDGIEDRRDRLCFHSLRHSYASNLVSSGSGLYVVSQLLGHADVTMAARYSHLENGSLKKAVANMEKHTQAQEPQAKVVELKR